MLYTLNIHTIVFNSISVNLEEKIHTAVPTIFCSSLQLKCHLSINSESPISIYTKFFTLSSNFSSLDSVPLDLVKIPLVLRKSFDPEFYPALAPCPLPPLLRAGCPPASPCGWTGTTHLFRIFRWFLIISAVLRLKSSDVQSGNRFSEQF